MKKLCLTTLTAFLAASAWAGEQKPPAAVKGPRISVEPPSFDFGKALQQKTLTKEFSIRNFGTETLIIEGVTTDCGCTVAEGYDKVIKPGGTTPLRVSLQTRANSGRITKRVLIRSNDPSHNPLEIKLEATVVPGP